MKEETQLGLNRTGIQVSPFDAAELLSAISSTAPSTPGDESALAEVRAAYINEAEPVGSVPVPTTIKGALSTVFSMLTGDRPELFLDKLGERLAFERTGTRLYDSLIVKAQALEDAGGGMPGMTIEDLRQIRADEARHFSMLADAIQSLGGDPTSQTPCADVAGVEALGLTQVINDPRTTLGQSLHAILVAEMADQHGWEMLIALAEDNGQSTMVSDFNVALSEERRHLQQVQRWYEEEILGISVSDEATGDTDTTPPQHLH